MEWYEDKNLMDTWDWEKNQDIAPIPSKYSIKSHKKVNWICNKGHRWPAEIRKRAIRGDGCPFCSGRYAIKGETDLASTHKTLAKEWDYTRNGDLKPTDVKAGTNKSVYWICEKGHSYPARISDRTKKGEGCPFCANKKIMPGENDLASTHKDIAKQWDYDANGKYTPKMFTYGSNKSFFWKCDNGHKWPDTIKNRVKIQVCLYCAGKKLIEGRNDLAALYPKLAEEWHPKNKKSCSEYFCQSNETVWWICKNGHEWPYPIYGRIRGDGCPFCSGKKPIPGKTDLKSIDSDLCEEWDYSKNRRGPETYLPYSNEKVWWVCKKCGHEWKREIYHRSMGTGCPECSKAN